MAHRITYAAWLVADQGLFACANFVLHVLLGRWLHPDEYGLFALAYVALTFVAIFHNAMLLEPTLIFGAARYGNERPAYLLAVNRLHWLLMTAIAFPFSVIAAGFWMSGAHLPSQVIVTTLLMLPGTLWLWLKRRECVAEQRPWLAATGGAIYLVAVVAGAIGLQAAGVSSLGPYAAVIGSAGALAGLVLSVAMRRPRAQTSLQLGEVARAHWQYGRWAALAGGIAWLPLNAYALLLPGALGPSAVGAVKAMMTLVMPAMQLITALQTFLLPFIARRRNSSAFERSVRLGLVAAVACAGVQCLVLVVRPHELMHLIYGDTFEAYSGYLWIVALLPLAYGVSAVFDSALRALERTDVILRATLVVAVFTIASGAIGLGVWGVGGLLGAMTASAAVSSLALWAGLARVRRGTARLCEVSGAVPAPIASPGEPA